MNRTELLRTLKAWHEFDFKLMPFTDPCSSEGRSPYDISIIDFVTLYAYSDKRKEILKGLLEYRLHLSQSGVINGYQWLSGSFVENVEAMESRDPNDIDVVSVIDSSEIDKDKFLIQLYNTTLSKQQYHVDCNFIDLSSGLDSIINRTTYWYGLFSHTRTRDWKGMYRVYLYNSELDRKAAEFLGGLV